MGPNEGPFRPGRSAENARVTWVEEREGEREATFKLGAGVIPGGTGWVDGAPPSTFPSL